MTFRNTFSCLCVLISGRFQQNVDVSVSVLSTYIYKITSKCKTSKPISLIELIFYYDKLQTCGEPSISKYKNPKLGDKADFSTSSLMFALKKHFVVKIQSVEFSSEREARLHFPLNTTCVSFTDAEQRKLKISAACAHRRTMWNSFNISLLKVLKYDDLLVKWNGTETFAFFLKCLNISENLMNDKFCIQTESWAPVV